MYLVDTVVLSELRKPQRDRGVIAWFERQRTADLFISVISMVRSNAVLPDNTRRIRALPPRSQVGLTGC